MPPLAAATHAGPARPLREELQLSQVPGAPGPGCFPSCTMKFLDLTAEKEL